MNRVEVEVEVEVRCVLEGYLCTLVRNVFKTICIGTPYSCVKSEFTAKRMAFSKRESLIFCPKRVIIPCTCTEDAPYAVDGSATRKTTANSRAP